MLPEQQSTSQQSDRFGIPGDLRQRPLDALQRLLHERGVLQEEKRPQEPPHPQFLKKEGTSFYLHSTSTRDFILTGLLLRPLTFDLSVFLHSSVLAEKSNLDYLILTSSHTMLTDSTQSMTEIEMTTV